ncbi:hypothetical protein JCM14076_21630 [Methylosoma difficile]
MKNLQRYLLRLLGLGLMLGSTSACSQTLEEGKVFAALALNIVRFAHWPPDTETQMQTQGSIDFCVVGDNVTQQSFADIDNKIAHDRTLHVINLSRIRNVEQCHVLYVANSQDTLSAGALLQLLQDMKVHPLLTIGESYDFASQGGMVGLDSSEGKVHLIVNLDAVHTARLNISARLLTLAKIIEEPRQP